jgi:membrane protein
MATKLTPYLVVAGLALARKKNRSRREGPRPARFEPPRAPAAETPATRTAQVEDHAHEADRGRLAESPKQIPAKGWKDILLRTKKEFADDQIPMIAAGITFYSLLAMFPAMAALVSLYGLFADPKHVGEHLQGLSFLLPGDALKFIDDQMIRISAAHEGGLSFAFAIGLLLSIWSANGAMKAMITGLNIAYDEKEKRKFIKKTATSLAFTIGFLAFGILAIAAVGAVPVLETFIGKSAATIFGFLTWPVLLVGLGVGLALLYRYGPSRDKAKWQWISWGSAAALLLWIAASAAFSIYVANFANYNKTYGSLGAAIGFMTWIYFSSQVVLLGAELNAEIEHQTAKDTTAGPEKPLGARGAEMADTVGAKQGR